MYKLLFIQFNSCKLSIASFKYFLNIFPSPMFCCFHYNRILPFPCRGLSKSWRRYFVLLHKTKAWRQYSKVNYPDFKELQRATKLLKLLYCLTECGCCIKYLLYKIIRWVAKALENDGNIDSEIYIRQSRALYKPMKVWPHFSSRENYTAKSI